MEEQLKKWVVQAHKLERQIKECQALKASNGFQFSSARIQVACNEIEKARMAAGDIVRLEILGEEARGDKRFIPAEHDCVSNHQFIFPSSELDVIQSIKKELRVLLYDVIDFNVLHFISGKYSIDEMNFYYERLKFALHDCDRALGLRLGEIFAQAK